MANMRGMETIVANLVGKPRKEILHGRTYWVAPTTIIKGDAVLNGSKGPLLYPREEQARDPSIWNGMPLVVQHPMRDGIPISARDPQILNESAVGQFFRATFNGDSVGESWFDEELTKRADKKLQPEHRILPRLMRGDPIEQSTGVFTDNVPVENGRTTAGVPYTHVARNYRADHIAVLPDRLGACSVKDGCGINAPTRNEESMTCILNGEGVCVNCGGKGGKPGPCKMVTDDDRVNESTRGARQQTRKAAKATKAAQSGAGNPSDEAKISLQAVYRAEMEARASAGTAEWWSKNAVGPDGRKFAAQHHETTAHQHDIAYTHHEKLYKLGYGDSHDAAAKLHKAARDGHKLAGAMQHDRSLETNERKGDTVDRIATINYLTTNCDCWKGAGDKAILEAMPDAKLTQLKDSATTTNATPTINNGTPAGTRRSFAQMLKEDGTPEEQAVWNAVLEVDKRERAGMVERIVSTLATNEEARAKMRPIYAAMPGPQLKVIADAIPAPVHNGSGGYDASNPFSHLLGAPSFVGNGQSGVTSNGGDYDEDATLVPMSTRG